MASKFGCFIIECIGRGEYRISKELYDAPHTITFNNSISEDTKVRSDWDFDLVREYVNLVHLRQSMAFHFFNEGVMKDDVYEYSEVLREKIDFEKLFYFCENIGDVSMAYYASHFIKLTLVCAKEKWYFPLAFLRHWSGKYYSAFIQTLVEMCDEGESSPFTQDLPIVNGNKFVMEFYYQFCKLRNRFNGQLFIRDKKLKPLVTTELDKFTLEVIGSAIKFGSYLCDESSDINDLPSQPMHFLCTVCGCYLFNISTCDDNFKTYVTIMRKTSAPIKFLYREDEEKAQLTEKKTEEEDGEGSGAGADM